MKKLLVVLPLLVLSLTGCKVRATGDKYDITNYETRVYCNYRGNRYGQECAGCEPWNTLSAEKLHTAKSVTCESLGYDGDAYHCHYCVTWVVEQ